MSVEIAPIPFRVLKFCGLWRPVSWTSLRKLIYNGYTVLMFVILVTITLTVGIGVYQMPVTNDTFAENVFLMFALINAVFKATNMLLSRERFLKMLLMAQDDRWHNLRDPEEVEIRDRYSKTIRFVKAYSPGVRVLNSPLIVSSSAQ